MPPSCARRQSHATKGAVSSKLNRLADIPRARGCGARPYPSRHGCEPDDRGGGVPSQRCWPCKREQGVALPCRHVDQASSWDWAHPATSAPGVHQPAPAWRGDDTIPAVPTHVREPSAIDDASNVRMAVRNTTTRPSQSSSSAYCGLPWVVGGWVGGHVCVCACVRVCVCVYV
jgi:hypothetical protein